MNKNTKKAFTLIEISVVLVIIGIIISAVMSGRDAISSSESKEFYQTFARKYTTIIDGYYDRTGQELGDSDNDGYFDGVDINTSAITASGIDLSKLLSTNQSDLSTYAINSQLTGSSIIRIKLYSYTLNGKMENFLILSNIPKDIAIAIDKYVDGISDGTKGLSLATQTSSNDSNLLPNGSSVGVFDLNSLGTNLTNIAIMIEH